MFIPKITFEAITMVYGEKFAKTWFRAYSPVRTGN